MAPRTIALAVDGMEPSLLDRWMEAGELPNLAGVRDRGVGGTARCSSLSSAKQWTTHFTGVDVERHGITGFTRSGRRRAGDDAPDAKELVNLGDIEVRTYPKLLAERGVGVGLVNPLPLWPPLELEGGFCVAGLLTPPDSDRWTHPADLAEDLEARGYRIDVRYGDRPYGFVDDGLFEEVRLERLHEDIFDVLDARIEFTKAVLSGEVNALAGSGRDDPALLYVLLKSIDVIQHCFWAHMSADDEQFGDAILESYRRVDRLLGWIEESLDANVLVFGDHGFGPREEVRLRGSTIDRLAQAVNRRLTVPAPVERLYGRLLKSETTVDLSNPGRTTGVHAEPAAWLLAGPDIDATEAGPDGAGREVRFEDLTPTLFALLDEPIPASYVGEPVRGVTNDPGSVETDLSVRRRTRVEDDEVVSERLHNLGYAEMVDEE